MGQNLILDKMVAKSGLKPVLVKALGKVDADLALQLAGFSVCTGRPLSYAESWLDERGFDGSLLCSQRITDLLRRLGQGCAAHVLLPVDGKEGGEEEPAVRHQQHLQLREAQPLRGMGITTATMSASSRYTSACSVPTAAAVHCGSPSCRAA